jgi:hypothetical protein
MIVPQRALVVVLYKLAAAVVAAVVFVLLKLEV